MRPEVINIRSVMIMLLSLVLNTVMLSQTDQTIDGMSTVSNKSNANKLEPGNTNKRNPSVKTTIIQNVGEVMCPSDVECSKLGGPCLNCNFNFNCIYGQKINVTCEPLPSVNCTSSNGNKTFQRTMICRYCYQTDPWEHTCIQKANCNSVASPRAYYRTNCSVKSEILCLGKRRFPKNLPCNWTGGCRWSTALFLSITLGGFGADRFYLGHWQEGIGKLFSFGGLGVWTLIDVILISLHYLGPADGSLYI